MPQEPGPSDPEWRDSPSSFRTAQLEQIGRQLAENEKRDAEQREVRAEFLNAPGTDPSTGDKVEILKYFRFGQFTQPGTQREIARHYGMLAAATVLMCPDGDQRRVALQKLLEARDAALRSVMP